MIMVTEVKGQSVCDNVCEGLSCCVIDDGEDTEGAAAAADSDSNDDEHGDKNTSRGSL